MLEIIAILLVIIALGFVFIYNRFITLKNRIDSAWSQIDVQLKRRADLIPNLVEVTKGYMKYERKVFEDITAARAGILSAKTAREAAKADKASSDAVKTFFAVAENYPDLKASKNYLSLQEELSITEDKIANTRKVYNDTVLTYNQTVQQVPSNLVAMLFNFQRRDYFQVEDKDRNAVKVSI